MARPARTIDIIDVTPAFVQADADRLNARYAGVAAPDLLRAVLQDELPRQVAMVSSFGAESAVLLHMVAKADPTTPVIFTDTLKMFPETLAYRDLLIRHLGLADVRTVMPDPAMVAAKDAAGERHAWDPDGCCEIRKIEPLKRALAGFNAWISGRKGFQAATRAALPLFEIEEGRLKINPLAGWTKAALDAYFATHDLPRHPLEAEGYLSIGCAPCTSKVLPGEDPRAGRWRGMGKIECGIHVIGHGGGQSGGGKAG